MDLSKSNKSREKKDRRSLKGAETRRKILAHAMAIAAREGLAGLTIGRLARDLRMSKSGLFAHFRSKRSLEMATINQARNVFTSQVLAPARAANEGIEQLWVLCNSWLAHIERRVFPGGYFFTGAFFECAERSGSIEDEINRMAREWWETLRNAVQKAQDRKEIDLSIDARRISFDLNGTLLAGYWNYLAEKNEEIFVETRSALFVKMKSLATARIPDYAFKSEKAWKEYLERRHVYKEKPPSSLRRVGRPEAQSGLPSSSTPSQPKQPPKKSGSVFDSLRRLTKR
jgi:AcrR family transcriptional regulator